jgi:hypothetical protein
MPMGKFHELARSFPESKLQEKSADAMNFLNLIGDAMKQTPDSLMETKSFKSRFHVPAIGIVV